MSDEELDAIPLDAVDLDENESESKIRTFGGGGEKVAQKWKRAPNTTGTGATHVKTFYAKLRVDALEFLDDQVNAWLDENPEFEVKFVTTTVGELAGKTKEAALFLNVWV